MVLLACAVSVAVAADPVVSVDRATLALSANANEIVGTQITVTNTGTAVLRLRLRDSGSGVNGVAQTPQVLDQYQTSSWGSDDPTGIAFDGLNLWYIERDTGKFLVSDLETCTHVSTITPTGLTWKPGNRLVWDGSGVWVSTDSNNYVAGQALPRRLGHYRPDGIADAQILMGDETTTRAAPTNPAWDGRRLWYNDAGMSTAFTVDTAAANARTLTPVLGSLQFFCGKDAWAGYLWGIRFRSSSTSSPTGSLATDLIRVDPQTAAVTNRTVLPVEVVEGSRGNVDGVTAHTVDGFGRFLAVTRNRTGRLVTHFDSGVRGWMSSPDTSHVRIDLEPGESRTLNIRMNGSVSGSGTHTSALWFDSNDSTRRRVVVPVTFTVSTQPAAGPVAVADSWTTDRDIRLDRLAPGLMANDRGVAPLSAQVVGSPSHGSVTVAADGTVAYTPAARYVGVDTFTYRITDGQGRTSAPATVTVTMREVPHIAVTPTLVAASVLPTATTQVGFQITNTGAGILRVSLVDGGSGGTPGSISALGRITPRKDILDTSNVFCFDGQAYWTFNHTDSDLIRIDAVTGAELDRLPHSLQLINSDPDYTYAVGMAWTGRHVAVLDRGSFAAPSGNPSGAFTLRVNPRIHLYDVQSKTRIRSIEVPVGLGSRQTIESALAFDGTSLWSAAYYRNATYRTDMASGITTVLPRLTSSKPLGQLAWYDGSLWAKDGFTIKRFVPTTGVLVGSWTWPTSGDTTEHNTGIDSLGGGRFALSAGSKDVPQILRIDSGMRGWMSVAPTTLDIPAGTTRTATVTMNASRAVAGLNTAIIRVLSNDVDHREVIVSVSLTVVNSNGATPPNVNAGLDQTIILPASASLAGQVASTTSGLIHAWTVVSGPGTATFSPATSPTSTAIFSTAGVYVLRLTSTSSAGSTSDDVTIIVQPAGAANRAPVVGAGADQSITLPATASLVGTATDDGLPTPGNLTITWSVVGGPGTVTFSAASLLTTTATFSVPGVYELQLEARDGALPGRDTVVVTVNPPGTPNRAPTVNAGVDQTITLPAPASLSGTVSDDGLPAPSALIRTWSRISGPGAVTFSAPNAAATSATFSAPGVYELQLAVSDGALTGSALVRVTVNPAAGGGGSPAPAVGGGGSGGSGGCGLGSGFAALLLPGLLLTRKRRSN